MWSLGLAAWLVRPADAKAVFWQQGSSGRFSETFPSQQETAMKAWDSLSTVAEPNVYGSESSPRP
jgi:hypothetical protein